MTFIEQYAQDHFGKRRIKKLARKGARIIGAGCTRDGTTLYHVDHNGMFKVLTWLDVERLINC